ncbi:nuclear transport factor 2 family protein [Mycobacterium sp. NPDC003323]
MSTSEIATVLAWHDALNARDHDTLLKLSTDDIEIATSDRAAQGHQALLDWAQQGAVSAEAGKLYVHDGVVVAEQTVNGTGGPGTAASAFRVVHDQIAAVFVHDSLDAALAATGLTEKDLDT